MNRKTLITIAVVAVVILLGISLYFYLQKKPAAPTLGGVFPSGSQAAPGGVRGGAPEETNIPLTPPKGGLFVEENRLYELHKTPVAGVGFVEGAGSGISVRYIERGLGHIFETPLRTLSEARISNDTHAHLAEALFGNNSKNIVIRYLDDAGSIIKTHILNITGTPKDTSSNFVNVDEISAPDFIPFMAIAGDNTDKIFYLENSDTASYGSLSTFGGENVTNIFNSSFTEWLPEFPNQNIVTLTTRPGEDIPGSLYFLDTKTKALTKILGGVNDLTTKTSRDGKTVLYSETKNGSPSLFAYDVAKKTTINLSLKTLPEKCAWSAKELWVAYCATPKALTSAVYPDQWYQGLVSFSDNVFRVDTRTGTVNLVFESPALDVINPMLSSNDSYLLFMNKVTGTPWIYRLANTFISSEPMMAPKNK